MEALSPSPPSSSDDENNFESQGHIGLAEVLASFEHDSAGKEREDVEEVKRDAGGQKEGKNERERKIIVSNPGFKLNTGGIKMTTTATDDEEWDLPATGFDDLVPGRSVTRRQALQAINLLRGDLAEREDDLRLQNSLGNGLFRLGLYGEAVFHVQQAVDLFLAKYGDPNAFKQRRKEEQRRRRERRKAGGDPRPDEAERDLFDDGKSASMAYCTLGWMQYQAGNSDLAAVNFERAVTVDAKQPTAHNNWARMLEERGHFNEALVHYVEALKLRPDMAISYHHCGVLFDKLNQPEKAQAYLRRALELNDNLADTHFALAISLSRATRRGHLAIPHLERTVQLEPLNSSAWLSLGIALEAIGGEGVNETEVMHLKHALECFEHACSLNPKSRLALRTLRDFQKKQDARNARDRQEAKRAESLRRQGVKGSTKASARPLAKPKCAVCNQLGSLACSRCKQAFYCSADHQRVHWKTNHKNSCNKEVSPKVVQ